jgi:tryptophan synthase alpha chain
MNRIDKLFNSKQSRVISIYFTAGYPYLESIERIILSLESEGADMIEIGIPYSDPLADGPIIQQTGKVALDNGMSIGNLFKQIDKIRTRTSIPLVLMGYLNPVMQYGFMEFCSSAANAGIDGLIIPDLPLFEYRANYRETVEKNDLKIIFLITPDTALERIREIDELSSGFIYLVSSPSTTGNTSSFNDHQLSYFRRIASLGLKNRTMVGFGIHNKETIEDVFRFGHGAIIGSAYLRVLMENKSIESASSEFFNVLKQATE